ncbi:23S rRNA pseudouridylate synthase [Corynebacterium hylobatis]|uniref:RNA pseudouridylate synthase n=1 Tax=Corynebacterium hylobatis TaxID=1859290 RepID=A0A3S0B5L0_9CORY|nr:pseudouridine synthase [Corynebacterium hylobatis]RSZ64775.1 23S rRNA pseudouridylate synthase [Corynebacterium hylobatis]
MNDRLVQPPRRQRSPLPVRDGLTATRARLPEDAAAMTAGEFVGHLITTQRRRHPLDDAAALQARFDAGEVVDRRGHPFSFSSPVAPGEDVFFYRTPAPEEPVPYDIDILHRDDDLLVADKPPFLATMPRGKHITETLTVRLRRSLDLPDLVPAHRLDRFTSGVILCTLRPEIRGAYQRLFAERRVEKTYEAIADHEPSLFPGTVWRSRMEKIPGEIQGRIIDGEPNAITLLADVTPLNPAEQRELEAVHGPLPPQARYILHPETGRTHQLRLHMWAAGVPILGDNIYPRIHTEEEEDMSRPLHLISTGLSFEDPLTGEPREFTVPRRLFHGRR